MCMCKIVKKKLIQSSNNKTNKKIVLWKFWKKIIMYTYKVHKTRAVLFLWLYWCRAPGRLSPRNRNCLAPGRNRLDRMTLFAFKFFAPGCNMVTGRLCIKQSFLFTSLFHCLSLFVYFILRYILKEYLFC